MSDQSAESLSALMDGELGDFELRRVLERVADEPELGQRWQRYHVARSAMHAEQVSSSELDLSAAVMEALQGEETYQLDNAKKQHMEPAASFWKPLTSMAVAASVTAMVIFGAQQFNGNSPETQKVAAAQPSYTLPTSPISRDLIRAQYGERSATSENYQEPDIIRLPQGLEHYIAQHQQMLEAQEPKWTPGWLPEGFVSLRRDVVPNAELQVYSNGRNAFTVCIEAYGHQSVSDGVAQSADMVAVGKRIGEHFVTVVGDVPLMIAERIAASVHSTEN